MPSLLLLLLLLLLLPPEYLGRSHPFKQAEKTDELRLLLEKHGQLLVQDGNLGLAKQLIKSLVGRKIRKLTRAYVTLSLQGKRKRDEDDNCYQSSLALAGVGIIALSSPLTTTATPIITDIARQSDLPDAATAEKYIVEMVC